MKLVWNKEYPYDKYDWRFERSKPYIKKKEWDDYVDYIKPNKPQNPEDMFDKQTVKYTKDKEPIMLTYGEIYELKKAGYIIEEMTLEEVEKALLAIRL